MTAVDGQLEMSPTGGYANPHVTSALRSVDPAWIGWPTGQADMGTAPVTHMTHVVAAAHPRVINGAELRSYAEDYYDRMHIRPTSIALGNLISSQTRTIAVWNAWRSKTVQLQALTEENADGITLTGAEPPQAFAPLQERDWTVSIDQSGPSLVDAIIHWTFADGETVQVTITGQRIVAWMLTPDWSDGINETLAWLTDMQQAYDGSQLREPLREAPRRAWKFGLLASGDDRRILESALYDWGARIWALPVWPDVTWLTGTIVAGSDTVAIDTRDLDYVVGGLAMLYHDARAWEVVEIANMTADQLTLSRPTSRSYGAGDRIYPCRMARLTDAAQVARKSDDVMTADISMQAAEPCDWEATAPTATYLDVPVLDAGSDWGHDRTAGYGRQTQVTDNDIGLPDVIDPSGKPWLTVPYSWVLDGRAERAVHRSLLYWLQGRAQALWLPSGAADLALADTLASNSTTMQVAWAGVTRYQRRQPGRRHLRIELTDGSVFYRKVTASTDAGDTEQLALDSALGVTVDPADVRLISWMMLATLASDSVQIKHVTDSHGVAQCSVSFAAVPAEEP